MFGWIIKLTSNQMIKSILMCNRNDFCTLTEHIFNPILRDSELVVTKIKLITIDSMQIVLTNSTLFSYKLFFRNN